MKIFILEDNPDRIYTFMNTYKLDEVTISNNAHEAIKILKNSKFDLIFLDHDLGGQYNVSSLQQNTGAQVVPAIKEQNLDTPIIIHSFNSRGAQNMNFILEQIGHCGQVLIKPFSNAMFNLIENVQ